MNKQITFEYNDKKYALEFTRASVERLERQGFSLDELDAKPATMMPLLFTGAFYANHSNAKRGVVDEIYNSLPNKSDLFTALGRMYGDALNTLFEEPEEDGKNVNWEKNF
jgi:hypothetical protein